jgi:hypothetical protein
VHRSDATRSEEDAELVDGRRADRGGLLVARMEDEIATSEHHVGQRFAATLAAPFTDETGTIRIAPGAKLVGRVTEIRRGMGARPGVIALRFEELVDGTTRYRLDAPVTAADVQQGTPELDSSAIRTGVLGGLLMGSALGGAPGVLLGAGLGSGAGVARATRQRIVDARIPAKSYVTAHVHAVTQTNGPDAN